MFTKMITPIIKEIKNPPSAVSLFAAIKDRPYSFFLDSSLCDTKLGRFSIMGSDPFLVFRSKRSSVVLEWASGKTEKFQSDPFTALKKIMKRYAVRENSLKIPFVSCGGVGYFAYDLKDFVEDLPDTAIDDIGAADCIIGFYDTAVIYDNIAGKAYVAGSGPEAKTKIEKLNGLLSRPEPRNLPDKSEANPTGPIESNFTRSSYAEAIMRAKLYIKRGDIYQVNLSQRFSARFEEDPFPLYLRLREISPAPFSAYLNFGDTVILSSSPERFLLKNGDYIETRPIKGTRPRGADDFEDRSLAKELLESAKDRAEHIMIVDLERNDLGRVCEYGSVKVTEPIVLEKYSNVFHLVSTVAGRVKNGMGALDCLKAAFPGGSITGAPKIRSMEIIEELEPIKRSAYTGAIGYLSFDGRMDTSIVIRTFVVKDKKIYFQVGGGIVADSDPDSEYDETIDKARGLLAALGVTDEGLDKRQDSRYKRRESLSLR